MYAHRDRSLLDRICIHLTRISTPYFARAIPLFFTIGKKDARYAFGGGAESIQRISDGENKPER